MNSPIPLAAAFPAFSEDDWRSAVARTRGRGAGIPEDFRAPAPDALFPRRVGARPVAGRPAGAPCRIVQRATADEAAAVAAIISEDVAGGATGAEIVFAGSAHPLGGQLPVESATSIAASLAVGMPERFWLRVDTGSSAAAAEAFLDLAAARGAELVFTFDPIAALAARGPSATPAEIDTGLAALGRALEERGIDGAAVIADGRIWHAGGATEEQELGAAIATFVAHLRVLGKAERIGIALAADADQFRGIAKFRAMRLLLARVGEVAGLTASPRVHAETAWRMMSRRDSEMNILRTTSATFAAAVGGADSISVLPFDAVDGDDAHARRLARNTQTILAEESHLFRVADPAAGSGAIETLTAAFAEAAWKRFQAIEAEGGIVAAIAAGSLLREVAEAREARIARVSAQDLTMVGVNAYTHDGVTPAAIRMKRVPVGRTTSLRFRRLSETFEDVAG